MTRADLKFSDADIESLKKAIAKGAQTVTYGDRSVTYRSLDEMVRLFNIITASRGTEKKAYYPSFSTGRLPR